MVFAPHTPAEIESMLKTIGVDSVEALFEDVPAKAPDGAFAALPSPQPEMAVAAECRDLANSNRGVAFYRSFLGAGAYEHFIPAAVDHILRRGEFFTAYTPYQAEASQGTLRAIYEFQSMICALTGLDVANASLYDGASAAAEAVLLAMRQTRRSRVALPRALHPAYRQVIETYTRYLGVEFVDLPFADGVCDVEALAEIDGELAAVVVAQPNALGCVEPAESMARWAHERGALVVGVVNPLSLAILKPPGQWGADIAVGEGQPLGLPLSFGGPYFGFVAVRKSLARQMPGRLAGRTVDSSGREGYVLTLQTREQHIRRERATSNICTNQALCALAATVYLALMGKNGLRQVAHLNLDRSHYVFQKATALEGIAAAWDQPFFNEFVLRLPCSAEAVVERMKGRGYLAGWPLSRWPAVADPGCADPLRRRDSAARGFAEARASAGRPGGWDERLLLVCVTETKSQRDCDDYVRELGSGCAGCLRLPAVSSSDSS